METVAKKLAELTRKGMTRIIGGGDSIAAVTVPLFRVGKKLRDADVENKKNTKQVLKKKEWVPDFTKDAFVRKGRASAYQVVNKFPIAIMHFDFMLFVCYYYYFFFSRTFYYSTGNSFCAH